MKKILVLFAHPAFHKSRINNRLIDRISDLEGVTINNLYEKYPDFFIDIRVEQKLLVEHDIIVWHHPFYWYSAPAIIKEWMDLVLEHGFAYGMNGKALSGKWALSVISTGGRKEVYSISGSNHFTINQFLAPFNQSANLCRMKYLPPFVIHGSHTLTENDLQNHSELYRKLIISLRDEKLNESEFITTEYLNSLIK
jgi:glutathione-regulated potassium-efflux system ancillary protein KefG